MERRGCGYCEAFRKVVPIRLPQDFYTVQERALAAVRSGVLQVVSGGLGWSDFVECELVCARCGARYQLACETYHGAGGMWQPTEPDAAAVLRRMFDEAPAEVSDEALVTAAEELFLQVDAAKSVCTKAERKKCSPFSSVNVIPRASSKPDRTLCRAGNSFCRSSRRSASRA